MLFSLPSNPTPSDVSEALNYLLNNFGSNVSINTGTGSVAGPTGNISYLYQYLDIKYATSFDGSVGFSNVPTNAFYFGIRNANQPSESTNPADYLWQQVTGGFGTTNFLYYSTGGGRTIQFQVASTSPGSSYVIDPGTAINLDIVTGVNAYNAALPTIYQWTSGSAPTRPSTTSTYTFATASFTPPSGWYSSIPSDTTAGDTLWAISIPLVYLANVPTATLDWTNTSYPIVQISKNGSAGPTGSNGLSALTAYQVVSQTSSAPATPSNTTGPTAPSGWSLTAPSVSVGYVLYYTFGQYNSSSGTINGIPAGQTQWGTPTAASVFQDIRSDNWNGSNPPTPGSPSTYGTTGYYIQKSSGSMYLNSVYGRGIAQFDGTNTGTSGSTAAILANLSLNQNAGIEAYTNNTFLTSGAVRAYNSQSGAGNAVYGYQGGTGNAVLGQSANGIGVNGTGSTGIQGTGTIGVNGYGNTGSYGVIGQTLGTGYGVYSSGIMGTNNSGLVTNLYSQFTQTVVGTGGTNQLRFVQGTLTGSGVASFVSTNKPGSSTGNTWIQIQIDSSTFYIPVWT
jgi:hypothetical protein